MNLYDINNNHNNFSSGTYHFSSTVAVMITIPYSLLKIKFGKNDEVNMIEIYLNFTTMEPSMCHSSRFSCTKSIVLTPLSQSDDHLVPSKFILLFKVGL